VPSLVPVPLALTQRGRSGADALAPVSLAWVRCAALGCSTASVPLPQALTGDVTQALSFGLTQYDVEELKDHSGGKRAGPSVQVCCTPRSLEPA
jgi:hypothetical protein